MVSGVGSVSQLAPHDISVVAGRPGVEQNMSDHIIWSISHEVNVETLAVLQTPWRVLGQQLSYFKIHNFFLPSTVNYLNVIET